MIFRQAETAACLLCAEIWRRETADLTDRLNCIVRKLRGAGISLIYQHLYRLASKIKPFILDISIGGKRIFCHLDQKAAPLFALHLIGGYGRLADPEKYTLSRRKANGKPHRIYYKQILQIFKTIFLSI